MDKEKLVSIIIPTYGRATTLKRSIESVLNQSYKNTEIIVVDDNNPGTEGRITTENMMKKYNNNHKIHYLQHAINKNGSAARNTGIKYSQGEYLMFLDDDDEFINNKISAQVKKMNTLDNSWGASYTSYIRMRNNKVIMRSGETREGSLLKEELMRNLFVHAGSNLMVRRNVVKELKGFDESFERNQDIEFLIRLLMKYKLSYVDEVGLIVNYDDKVITWDFEEVTQGYLNKFNPVITQMNKEDQKKIYQMINLQLLRHYLTTSGKRKKAIKLIQDREISISLSIRYIIHLGRRFIKKEAYGFNI